MSGARFSARLERLTKALQEGFAASGGCYVCREWPNVRDATDTADPWAAFEGVCPVCGRAAEALYAADAATAARLAPDYAGRPLKVYLAGANPADL